MCQKCEVSIRVTGGDAILNTCLLPGAESVDIYIYTSSDLTASLQDYLPHAAKVLSKIQVLAAFYTTGMTVALMGFELEPLDCQL